MVVPFVFPSLAHVTFGNQDLRLNHDSSKSKISRIAFISLVLETFIVPAGMLCFGGWVNYGPILGLGLLIGRIVYISFRSNGYESSRIGFIWNCCRGKFDSKEVIKHRLAELKKRDSLPRETSFYKLDGKTLIINAFILNEAAIREGLIDILASKEDFKEINCLRFVQNKQLKESLGIAQIKPEWGEKFSELRWIECFGFEDLPGGGEKSFKSNCKRLGIQVRTNPQDPKGETLVEDALLGSESETVVSPAVADCDPRQEFDFLEKFLFPAKSEAIDLSQHKSEEVNDILAKLLSDQKKDADYENNRLIIKFKDGNFEEQPKIVLGDWRPPGKIGIIQFSPSPEGKINEEIAAKYINHLAGLGICQERCYLNLTELDPTTQEAIAKHNEVPSNIRIVTTENRKSIQAEILLFLMEKGVLSYSYSQEQFSAIGRFIPNQEGSIRSDKGDEMVPLSGKKIQEILKARDRHWEGRFKIDVSVFSDLWPKGLVVALGKIANIGKSFQAVELFGGEKGEEPELRLLDPSLFSRGLLINGSRQLVINGFRIPDLTTQDAIRVLIETFPDAETIVLKNCVVPEEWANEDFEKYFLGWLSQGRVVYSVDENQRCPKLFGEIKKLVNRYVESGFTTPNPIGQQLASRVGQLVKKHGINAFDISQHSNKELKWLSSSDLVGNLDEKMQLLSQWLLRAGEPSSSLKEMCLEVHPKIAQLLNELLVGVDLDGLFDWVDKARSHRGIFQSTGVSDIDFKQEWREHVTRVLGKLPNLARIKVTKQKTGSRFEDAIDCIAALGGGSAISSGNIIQIPSNTITVSLGPFWDQGDPGDNVPHYFWVNKEEISTKVKQQKSALRKNLSDTIARLAEAGYRRIEMLGGAGPLRFLGPEREEEQVTAVNCDKIIIKRFKDTFRGLNAKVASDLELVFSLPKGKVGEGYPETVLHKDYWDISQELINNIQAKNRTKVTVVVRQGNDDPEVRLD